MRFKMLALASASLLAISVPFAANAAKPVYGDWGYDSAAMDKSVKPGDDFWEFVNGNWDKKTQIAADRASAGPFVVLSDKAEKDVRDIVEPGHVVGGDLHDGRRGEGDEGGVGGDPAHARGEREIAEARGERGQEERNEDAQPRRRAESKPHRDSKQRVHAARLTQARAGRAPPSVIAPGPVA